MVRVRSGTGKNHGLKFTRKVCHRGAPSFRAPGNTGREVNMSGSIRARVAGREGCRVFSTNKRSTRRDELPSLLVAFFRGETRLEERARDAEDTASETFLFLLFFAAVCPVSWKECHEDISVPRTELRTTFDPANRESLTPPLGEINFFYFFFFSFASLHAVLVYT